MIQALNTLYVMTPGAYVRLDHDTLKVEIEREVRLQVPLLHLGGITCFGNVLLTSAVIHRCADEGRSIVLLDGNGHFKARMVGKTSGNVLLRRAQHEAAMSNERAAAIARNSVAGKLQNSRQVVLRAGREAITTDDTAAFADAARRSAGSMRGLGDGQSGDEIRGYEGEAARTYFSVFDRMIRSEREEFRFSGRVRRPPIGRTNALLSFLYALLLNDCVAACEGVGLDPQVGFLHAIRPGRPALALDLIEEFRAYIADRLVLTLINRQQLRANDFEILPGGAARLTDAARKRVVVAYQERKRVEVNHPVLGRAVPIGIVPHVQAQLLARHLRGDLAAYPPFRAR